MKHLYCDIEGKVWASPDAPTSHQIADWTVGRLQIFRVEVDHRTKEPVIFRMNPSHEWNEKGMWTEARASR